MSPVGAAGVSHRLEACIARHGIVQCSIITRRVVSPRHRSAAAVILTLLHLEGHGVGVQYVVEALVGSVIFLDLLWGKVHVGVADGVVDGDLHHLVVAVDPEGVGRGRGRGRSGVGKEESGGHS